MAKIFNHSKYTLAVLAREFSLSISSQSSAEVPDDVVRAWAKHPSVQAFVDAGRVVLAYGDDAPRRETALDLSDLSAADVRKLVSTETDLDALAELYAAESRKTVLDAIEKRMAALR